ncbi:MAG: shikimate dehydrogenase [Thermodesulfobacteriota bacterium]|nr:shikimate dehydrogenase [Thermodesulfobacteriota bacterium]
MKPNKAIDTATQFCMVIGDPIAHSLSPAIHNAGYAAAELNFVYLACRVADVKSALTGMRSLSNFRGMSVTIPHKIDIMNHVDKISETDRAIGSINTVINENGRLVGLGTDGPGALKAITDAGVATAGKTVLMLGAGGAARAIAFTLARDAGLQGLTILDVNDDLRRQLAADLSSGTDVPVNDDALSDDTLARAMADADIIIHCTPVGMAPHTGQSLVPPDLFSSGQVVFDIVYTPLETKLLADATAKGLKTISGVEMFINQAVLQFERFTGIAAPTDVMRKIVMEHLTS